MWAWLSFVAVVAVVGLGAGLVGWLIRSKLRERRKARYFAQLSAQYRKARPALLGAKELPSRDESPRTAVTVDELVARLEAEGLATRLRWDKECQRHRGPNDDEWPTAVMPNLWAQ